MHAANIKRLQDWIALPSIAAENRNFSSRSGVHWRSWRRMPIYRCEAHTDVGKSGVFGKIDAAASTTMAIYFMYRREAIRARRSGVRPPLEARLVQRRLGDGLHGRGGSIKRVGNSFLSG